MMAQIKFKITCVMVAALLCAEMAVLSRTCCSCSNGTTIEQSLMESGEESATIADTDLSQIYGGHTDENYHTWGMIAGAVATITLSTMLCAVWCGCAIACGGHIR